MLEQIYSLTTLCGWLELGLIVSISINLIGAAIWLSKNGDKKIKVTIE